LTPPLSKITDQCQDEAGMNTKSQESKKRWDFALSHLWRSPWINWVGFRYLKSKKSSGFLSFITTLSVLGVGIGVAATIVVLSVMDGFEGELKKRLMSTELHLLITPTPETPGFEQGRVPSGSLWKSDSARELLLTDSRVDRVWPVLSTEAIMRAGERVTGTSLKGVTAERWQRVQSTLTETAEPHLLVERDGPDSVEHPHIYIGQELAYVMGLIPGDRVTMISPSEMEGPMASVPRMMRFVIAGVYSSGIPEQELHTVYARDTTVQSFLRKRDVLTEWEIVVTDFMQAPDVAKELRFYLPEFRVQDWIQLNETLFVSLRLERLAMFVVLIFTVIVASFNIVTTLSLMVLEKKADISILKAMGARNGQVSAIFIAEGLFIGLVGILGGLGLAFLVSSLLDRYQFISLPEIYYDQTLPVTFDPFYYGGVAAFAFFIVVLACWYPSRRAAKTDPLQGIRLG
jgi:lipoprotein-releasing system permease protein